MSVSRLHDGVCEQMEQTIRNFWWGMKNGKRKAHWIAWWKLARAKEKGGLGFRDFKLFNQAMLARQAWRLPEHPDSLRAQVMKAKYCPNGELIDTVFPSVVSPTWRAIMHGLDLLKMGLIWRVANGEKIHIWRHNWLPRHSGLRVTGRKRPCRFKRVAQLLNESGTSWDCRQVERFFLPHDSEVIQKIKIQGPEYEDILAWHYEKSGLFTVFDVAPFDLPYNAILRCPALAKFMADVHYAYSVLKIPGPSGIISVKANKGSSGLR